MNVKAHKRSDLIKVDAFIGRSFQLIILCVLLVPSMLFSKEKRVFVTATDTEHFDWTLNLLSGIYRFHDNIDKIAIFDIGLSDEEREHLQELECVEVYAVEKVNPQIFEKFTVNAQGKIARGLYSWKPVVIKQASALFPVFFYLDSGISLTGSLDKLFDHLEENGSFLIDCGHNIGRMTTKSVRNHFLLETAKQNRWILKEKGISAGFQGITRAIYSTYVYPLYQMAHDLSYFGDDGSCPKGFGFARHDQTLFSIQARLLGLTVHEAIRGEAIALQIKGKKEKVHLSDFIKITRSEFDLKTSEKHLKYQKETL